jgi:hypothetical protein
MLAARSPDGENGRLSSIEPGFGATFARADVAPSGGSPTELASTVTHASCARVTSGGGARSEHAVEQQASAAPERRSAPRTPRERGALTATIQAEQGMLGA